MQFSLPIWVDLAGVAVGSLLGAMFAAGFRDRRLDLLGVAILGMVVGLGGGMVRDVVLDAPLFAFSSNLPLLVSIVFSFIGMLLERTLKRIDPVLIVVDALALGLFAAAGTLKALQLGVPELPALWSGVFTAAGGGLIRDVMLGLPIAIMHVGSLYAIAAAAGSGAIIVVSIFDGPPMLALVLCIVITALIRLLAVRYGWSLPEQRALGNLQFPGKERLLRIRRTKTVSGDPDVSTVTGAISLPRMTDAFADDAGAKTDGPGIDPDDLDGSGAGRRSSDGPRHT